MRRLCEICESSTTPAPNGPAKAKLRRVLIDERILALCPEHAAIVRENDVHSVEELRARMAETDGNRSLVPRRSPLDRRIFPARPEGRRRNAGRRATDVD